MHIFQSKRCLFAPLTGIALIPGLVLSSAIAAETHTLQPIAEAPGMDVYRVETAPSGARIAIGGTVVPKNEVSLAAQMPGRIASIAGQEGDAFNKNHVLLGLDESALNAKRNAAIAALNTAQAAVSNAQVQFERERRSPQSNNTTRMPGMGMPAMMDRMFSQPMSNMMGMNDTGADRGADLHQRGTAITKAQAGVQQAQSQIAEIDASLRDAKAIAPFDGVITQKLVSVGDTVQPGQPLLVYADVNELQIRADLPARLARNLSKSGTIHARLDNEGTEVDLTVDRVFPTADPQQHTVTVKFGLPKNSGAHPGMYVDVLIPDPNSRNAALPVIPRSALVLRGSLHGVYVMTNGQANLRLVRIADEVGDDKVQVFSGLEAGEEILKTPKR